MTPELRARLAACRNEQERDALIVAVFAEQDRTQSEHNARVESYPPLWHGLNPLSPLVWIGGYVIVSAVWFNWPFGLVFPDVTRCLFCGARKRRDDR
jgi:hypothetical protein